METLHAIAKFNLIDDLNLILKSEVDINTKDEFGATALHYAIAYKNEHVISILLENHPDLTIQNKEGKTVLHSAIEYKLYKVAEALLKITPRLVHISDKHGNEPLWTACFNSRGNYEFVKLILEFKGDVNHKNNSGLCPLDIPKRTGDSELLKLLMGELDERKVNEPS